MGDHDYVMNVFLYLKKEDKRSVPFCLVRVLGQCISFFFFFLYINIHTSYIYKKYQETSTQLLSFKFNI